MRRCAARRSLLLASVLAATFLPSLASAALININTADAALLDTLPGIGPTIAQRIIDYRSGPQGPFETKVEIKNVSGIGDVTYADLEALITVGDTTPAPPTPDTTSAATSTPQTATMRAAGRAEPDTLVISVGKDRVAFARSPLTFSAQVTRKGSAVTLSTHLFWSFGDGSTAKGRVVEKTYTQEGTYLVTIDADNEASEGYAEFIVTVRAATVRIASSNDSGITIENMSGERLDLSGWHLRTSTGAFRIPRNTLLLPHARVLFSVATTKLGPAEGVDLLYPDGTYYAGYAVASPFAEAEGSSVVQTITPEPRSSFTSGSVRKNVTQAYAPTAAPQPAAVGAAIAATGAPATEREKSPTSSPITLLPSPWVIAGTVGALLAAGAAFIIL